MSQNTHQKEINILQNEIIHRQEQPTNTFLKRKYNRMTSSMYFLDEEPAFTDSDSDSEIREEISESSEKEIELPIKNTSPVTESINSIPEKRFSDMEVQCEILSANNKSNLKEIIKMCANLEPTGEYKELISVCQKLNNRIDDVKDVYGKQQIDPVVCSSLRSDDITTKTLRKKSISRAKRVAGVRKSYRIRKPLKSHLKTSYTNEDNFNTNKENLDSGELFECETKESHQPDNNISRIIVKSLARNWMKTNKSFSVLENSVCQQNYFSLQHPKSRRLYSPSQWLDSEDYKKSGR